MLQDFIATQITAQLPFAPTGQQEDLIGHLGAFLTTADEERVFLLRGYAGTGKTSVVSALVRALHALGRRTVLLAPTGRAAKVLSSYSGFPAYTVHKKIYRQRSMAENSFRLADNLHRDTLFVVDEASMIANTGLDAAFGSGRLLDDLITYVYGADDCRLLLVGDTAQLPPVQQSVSPALDEGTLAAYGLQVWQYTLTHVVRQALESGILYNATLLRERLAAGDTGRHPAFTFDDFDDIARLDPADLIDELQRAYSEAGEDDTIVITRSNRRATLYNNGIRARVLMREEEITGGDLLMVTKNNYFWNKPYEEIDFIANGDIVEVVRVRRHIEMYGFRFADLTLRSLDYGWEIDARVWLDLLQAASPAHAAELTQTLFNAVAEDYPEITNRRLLVKTILESPFYNALQVRYAYAVTCHKAQGGQWSRVFVDLGQVAADRLGDDYYRWLYTALTRATGQVRLVGLPE